MYFFDPSGKQHLFEEVVEATRNFVVQKPNASYEIVVGSDSHPADEVCFITAITIRRMGNGGIYFWKKSKPEHCTTLRDRIYREAMHSIILAHELRGRLQETLGDEFFWNDQIHIDVGEQGETRELIPVVVGMVKGFGFEAIIKPYAYGACTVADRHT